MKKYLFIFTLIFAFLPFIEKLEAQEPFSPCNCPPNGPFDQQVPNCNPLQVRVFQGKELEPNKCLHPCHCPSGTVCKVPPGVPSGVIGECRAPSS